MIPRRSSADSSPGLGSDATRSSIARSRCAWIGAVFDWFEVSTPPAAEVIVAPFWPLPAFARNSREQGRTAKPKRKEEYRMPAARVKSPERDQYAWHVSNHGNPQAGGASGDPRGNSGVLSENSAANCP